MATSIESKHSIEAIESWDLYTARNKGGGADDESHQPHRYLKHHHHHKTKMEKRAELLGELYADPGIKQSTVHGMIIDAGSTGSRLHIYEWEPRILTNSDDVNDAVSGRKLSYPGTESRWTDKLTPGLATLAALPDDELIEGVENYLAPLLEFATTVLHDKQEEFDKFPIFLRATAGMRTLTTHDRARVLQAVRTAFSDEKYCPFFFEEEHARVLSGEEEAIFAWTGVNFLLGNLVQESIGVGTVINPRLTYGALDLGGASTQMSYYEHQEDIMSNLFKLQIGQGKHWNVYAHSYLYYGINEATNRFEARLVHEASTDAEVYNPCLPGGASKTISSSIHFDSQDIETWEGDAYEATLKNDNERGDYEQCTQGVQKLLNLNKNAWCDFVHRGDCSFSGIYQPQLPTQSEHFGEFLAFSNYARVWEFLDLPERASLAQLQNATQHACSMSQEEVIEFAGTRIIDGVPAQYYCFRSVYVFELLHKGYGFQMDDYITAAKVVNGHKIGWALGAMLYEINTMPWEYVQQEPQEQIAAAHQQHHRTNPLDLAPAFLFVVIAGVFLSMLSMFLSRRQRSREMYEVVKDVSTVRHV